VELEHFSEEQPDRYQFKLIGRGTENLRNRTKQYPLQIIRLHDGLPKVSAAKTIGNQLLRSGTSVGAQYHEACRAKSDADFVSKVQGSLQELEESLYWLDLLLSAGIETTEVINPLMLESIELLKIFTSIVAKTNARKQSRLQER